VQIKGSGTRQIDPICATTPIISGTPVIVQNGGYSAVSGGE
jgi:hypothetical protein